MSRFKLKLTDDELRVVGSSCLYAVRRNGKVGHIATLALLETCERLWGRMRNMYRPDRESYTIRLSAEEVQALTQEVLPHIASYDEPFIRAIGTTIQEELVRQMDRELNIYNSMRYGA